MTEPALLAKTPPTPYYAVVFASTKSPTAGADYGATADRMVELAAQQPGFLGIDSARGSDGLGITVSYWRSEKDILRWKMNAEHTIAREMGREKWYLGYTLRVAKVERAYDWSFQQPE
eukprot:comp15123_c0_seq1/m.11802 comp15123_c0_seq1/g.11802  ORF comp15123_c0_seq1/g.11802 comp15123_c0_seq1/m.11802 type:complete len:118 (-) comp15123_c0_seq1:425-778(-)